MKINILTLKGIVLASAMLMASVTANTLKPTHKIADERPRIKLADMVPEQFGDWHLLPQGGALVTNPQAETLINKLYSQLLNRTYVNSDGKTIMLSISYGEDQRDGMQLHYPEVCYPAQGFEVKTNRTGTITTAYGNIPVRRLETQLNSQRNEPVTYWSTVGNQVTLGGISKKILEMKYGMHGKIPDGLLFRMSSIDQNSSAAFALQENFARELLPRLTEDSRSRLAGLTDPI
jgi:EpsI family protein